VKVGLSILILPIAMVSPWGQAGCFSGEELRSNLQIVLTGQTSFVHKNESIWQINGKNPYTATNVYNDIALKFASACSLTNDMLDLDFSLYALGYYPTRSVGLFEKDDSRSKVLTEKLRITWTLSNTVRLEGGKLPTPQGAFFLRSPAELITNYYSGFKPTRIYDPAMKSLYSDSYWGASISKEYRDCAFSLTISPKLANINNYYESSSNWSENKRTNSSERYLFGYADYRFENHSLSVNMMLGDSPSIALADSYNYTTQFIINSELALHKNQQWRHFSNEKKNEVLSGVYPSSLYSQEDKEGIEFSVGGQYTTNNFSIFGMEYYFQSEGYTESEWRNQVNFVKFLNGDTGYQTLNKAFDNYKYLMGGEISNTSNKGMLQGRHYVNTWGSLQNKGSSVIQPYLVMNLLDNSTLLGIHYVKPLKGANDQAEFYMGLYSAQGSKNSEFELFGDTVGVYFGFKYYL